MVLCGGAGVIQQTHRSVLLKIAEQANLNDKRLINWGLHKFVCQHIHASTGWDLYLPSAPNDNFEPRKSAPGVRKHL